MIDTHLNIFDSVVIGIMLLSCLFAFFRGLVREVLSLIAWIGAGVITATYYAPVAEALKEHFKNPAVAMSAAAIGLYIVALMGFAIINMVIIKTIKQGGETGMLDNTLGLAFGALRGAFIISLGFFLITTLIPKDEYPMWIKESITHPYAERGAIILTSLAPESLREISSLQKKATAAAQKRYETYDEQGSGYSRDSAHEVDRLSDTGPAR
jgi:membrane protein required for colicin V production